VLLLTRRPMMGGTMIEVIANDRLGRKGSSFFSTSPSFLSSSSSSPPSRPSSLSPTSVRVKCSPQDTVGDLKKLIAAQTGTNAKKVQLKKWCVPVLLELVELSSRVRVRGERKLTFLLRLFFLRWACRLLGTRPSRITSRWQITRSTTGW